MCVGNLWIYFFTIYSTMHFYVSEKKKNYKMNKETIEEREKESNNNNNIETSTTS